MKQTYFFRILDIVGLAAALAMIACTVPKTAPPDVPAISSPLDFRVTNTTATLGANVTDDNGAEVTERGVVYSETAINPAPALGSRGATKVAADTAGTGFFTVDVIGLQPSTQYSFFGYAINEAGEGYTDPVATFTTAARAGTTNTSLQPNVSGGTFTFVQATAGQPDGKTIIGGFFETVGGSQHPNLARLNFDGNVDESFTAHTNDGAVECIAIQPDGKIVIGGSFTKVTGEKHNFLARLNPNGSVESTTTFNPGTGPDQEVYAIAVQADGKILIAGQFTKVNNQPRNHLARLNPDGTLEDTATFNSSADGPVASVLVQPDEQILIGGEFAQVNGTNRPFIARLNPDGSLENTGTFHPGTVLNQLVLTVALQEDGGIVLGGPFTTPTKGIARLNGDGSVDGTFNPGTGADNPPPVPPAVNSVALQADGKIVIGGFFENVDGQPRSHIARLNPDGSVESTATFDIGDGAMNGNIYSVMVQPNGKILFAGNFQSFNFTGTHFIGLLDNDGAKRTVTTPDAMTVQWLREGAAPVPTQVSFELSIDQGENWTPLGKGTPIAGGGGWELTGLNPPLPNEGLIRARGRIPGSFQNGSSGLDQQVGFINTGFPTVTSPTSTNITATSADLGGNVVSDNGNAIQERGVVYSLTSDNADPHNEDPDTIVVPDATMGTTGVFSVRVDGLELGETYSFKAYATNVNDQTSYSPVATFTTQETPTVTDPTSTNLTDTSATLGGNLVDRAGQTILERGIIYYSSIESPDTDRLIDDSAVTTVPKVPEDGTSTGVFTVDVSGLDPDTDYSFVAYARTSVGTTYSELGEFTTTGSGSVAPKGSGGIAATAAVDPGFAPILTGSFVQAAALQPDGKTIIGGFFNTVSGAAHLSLARLSEDGTVDATFTAGTNGGVTSVVVQDDGKILIGGAFNVVNGVTRNGFARLNPDGSLEDSSTFSPGSGANGVVYSVAVQPDGKILLGGLFSTIDGTARSNLARLNEKGTLEATATFDAGTGPDDSVYSIALQPDGQILIGGAFANVNGVASGHIARLNPNGSLEGTGTFNPGTGANHRVTSVAVQKDGNILLGGYFTMINGMTRNHIARLNGGGSLEDTTTFNPGTGADGNVLSVAVQADGKILLGGAFLNVNAMARSRVARLNPDGTLDGTLNIGNGASGEVDAVVLQENGQVLLGGGFATFDGTTHKLIARLDNDAATDSLTMPDSTRLQWLRGGAAPEVSRVTFELSINGGAKWTLLGQGTRIAGGWERTGLNLPKRGIVRARGRTAGGYLNGSTGLVEQSLAFPTTIPVKDGPVTNGGGATFTSFGTPQTGPFAGTLQGANGKAAAIFALDGSVLLQTGVGGISKIGALSGDAVLLTVKDTVTGKSNVRLMTGLSAGTPVLAAQTGTMGGGLPAGVTIKKFLALDGNGTTTFFLATLDGTANSPALCAVTGVGQVKVVASEGQSVTIGAATRAVATLSTLVGSKGTLAANRWRVDDTHFGVRVTFPDKQQAIFSVPSSATTSADWTLMTKTGPISTITPLNGTVAASFGLPGFGSASVAQVVNLAKGGSVTSTNSVAITSGNSTSGFKQLARTGNEAPNATGSPMTGVLFKKLSDPVSGAGGAMAFAGTLSGAAKGSGFWFAADGATAKLLARTGTGADALAPGGGHWKTLGTMVLPADASRGPIFLATLTVSAAEGVTKDNSLGLWAVDSTGTLKLIFRTGQNALINGMSKQVKTFTALAPATGSIGAASGYDNNGNVALLVTFIDGSQELLVITVP